jgi:outer membrane autotransporter protein
MRETGVDVAAGNGALYEDELLAQNDAGDVSLPEGSTKRAARRQGENNCFWIEGFGDFARQNATNQLPQINYNSEGAFLGYDCFGFENGLVGVGAGYIRSNIHFLHSQGQGHINSYVIGPYGTSYIDKAYIELGLFGTVNQIQNKRHIVFTGYNAHAFNSHRAFQLTPHVGVGYDFVVDWAILEPFATVDWVVNWDRGYQERGASLLNMRVKKKTTSMLRSEVGLQAYQNLVRSWGICVLREVAAYVNKKPFANHEFKAAILGVGSSFTFESFTQTQNLLTLGFEMLFKGNNGFFASFEYDGEFFAGFMSNQGQVKLGKYF